MSQGLVQNRKKHLKVDKNKVIDKMYEELSNRQSESGWILKKST